MTNKINKQKNKIIYKYIFMHNDEYNIINNNIINKLINGVKFCRHSFVFDLIFVSPPDHMLPSVKKQKLKNSF